MGVGRESGVRETVVGLFGVERGRVCSQTDFSQCLDNKVNPKVRGVAGEERIKAHSDRIAEGEGLPNIAEQRQHHSRETTSLKHS